MTHTKTSSLTNPTRLLHSPRTITTSTFSQTTPWQTKLLISCLLSSLPQTSTSLNKRSYSRTTRIIGDYLKLQGSSVPLHSSRTIIWRASISISTPGWFSSPITRFSRVCMVKNLIWIRSLRIALSSSGWDLITPSTAAKTSTAAANWRIFRGRYIICRELVGASAAVARWA